MKVEIRVALTLSCVFVAGGVWWCEDCRRGGFAPYDPQRDWGRHGRYCLIYLRGSGR